MIRISVSGVWFGIILLSVSEADLVDDVPVSLSIQYPDLHHLLDNLADHSNLYTQVVLKC